MGWRGAFSLAFFAWAFSTAWAADPVVSSAASASVGVTPDSLATVRGTQLATLTAGAQAPPWPMSLGDISAFYVEQSGVEHQASLLYVSPSQINFLVPADVAPGPASLIFPFTGLPPGVGTAALRVVPFTIQTVAPGLFSLDGSGSGVAAATAVRVQLPLATQVPVPVFVCGSVGHCTAVPIALGIDTPVYLSLYGTGIRGASSLSDVVVTFSNINNQAKAIPLYAGPQGEIPGLDQVNVGVPLALSHSGLMNVTATVDGVTSNPVLIDIQ